MTSCSQQWPGRDEADRLLRAAYVDAHPGLREGIARALVRWADRWWYASYAAYVRREAGEVPGWWDKPWTAGARSVSAVAIPLAIRLDGPAASEQMAQAGWWG